MKSEILIIFFDVVICYIGIVFVEICFELVDWLMIDCIN